MLMLVIVLMDPALTPRKRSGQDQGQELERVFVCLATSEPITCLAWQSRLSAKVSAL